MCGIFGCLLSTTSGWAQSVQKPASSSEQHASEEAPNPERVAASDAVITIHGSCDPRKRSGADEKSCMTVVTREAFETLVNSMNVTSKILSQETRRNLAETYADYLALERAAVQAKLEDTPQFTEIMRWWRLRTLADMYRGELQAKFAHPTAEEVHTYYTERMPSYQRIRIQRVLIPKEPAKPEEERQVNKKALEMAQAARERIVKGENPMLVQKDIYSQLKSDAPPATNLGTLARSNFPKDEVDELFSLQPGQVSKVENEASYVIYKIEAKETLSEESQKESIAREISQQKFGDAMRAINESAKPEFNDAYLGPHPVAASRAHASAMTSLHP
jgi:hypothetical protein